MDVAEDDLETWLTTVFLVLSDWDRLVFLVVFWAVFQSLSCSAFWKKIKNLIHHALTFDSF
jgi:hypothetical protein